MGVGKAEGREGWGNRKVKVGGQGSCVFGIDSCYINIAFINV